MFISQSFFSPRKTRSLLVLCVLAAVAGAGRPASAQMISGRDMKDFDKTFDLAPRGTAFQVRATYAGSSIAGNVLKPGEQGSFKFQIENNTDAPLQKTARVEVVPYGTRGIPGDIWQPETFRRGTPFALDVALNVPAHGLQNLSVAPTLPTSFGGYALIFDPGEGQRQFLTTCARTFAPDTKRVQYPKLCLDELPLPVLKALGVKAIRLGVSYKPTTDKDFPQWFAEQGRHLKELQDANVSVLFMVGAGDFYHPDQPLGRPRPWLDAKGVMQDTKTDIAWTPDYDADFQKYTRMFATQYGWPRGPINAFSLWNEPWEGISISGWGADMLRYREMYRHMAAGVLQARQVGAQVLVGGTDSSSNALDKLFPDGSSEFSPIFDFLSIHYQGLSSSANLKQWRERKGYNGRVRIWDTESWVANTDDRVAAAIATNRASGYDRAMGVYGGNIAEEQRVRLRSDDSTTREVPVVQAWSTAAAIGAAQNFIGERPFREMLFQNGLPWIMRFDGRSANPEDGTLVVVGDLGEAFGADQVLFRTARGFQELKHKAELRRQLAALPAGAPERAALQKQLDTPEVLSGATLTIPARGAEFSLYDPYGNRVAPQNGVIRVPLDGRGFFLRANGQPGSFARLVAATKTARIEGIEPLATIAHDFTAPLGTYPALRLSLTNILNRPVSGQLHLAMPGVKLVFPTRLTFAPHQTLEVLAQVQNATVRPDNAYPFALRFDAGRDGYAVHQETMHVNVIARRTPQIDGNLNDWNGVLPQVVSAGTGGPSLTEAAWFPFKNFDAKTKGGLATGYLAYDAKNFYFAAKIADSTPDVGMMRFAKRDDDQFFYPAVSYSKDSGAAGTFAARWSGDIVAPTTGRYTLTTLSDDGVRLWVGGKPVIDNWTDHGPTEDVAIVDLKAGQPTPIRMEFFQSGGGATAKLFWQAPNGARELVPGTALRSGGKDGLQGEYFSGKDLSSDPLLTRQDAQVNFEWKSGEMPDDKTFGERPLVALRWPQGVRRYSYRTDPELPAGNSPNHDNVQIAFNVLPAARKPMLDALPGLPPKFTSYSDTDYEYALNPVASQYGGGTEVWRLAMPGMPRKHFYPRQPKSGLDGPAVGAKLVVTRQGNSRIVEAAIPWTEIPAVHDRLKAGQTIKFSFHVNDNTPSGLLELSRDRSVAKRNGSFHVDWVEHWANEVEFGWGK